MNKLSDYIDSLIKNITSDEKMKKSSYFKC